MKLDKVIDLFMFRETASEEGEGTVPVITVGSIVWGVMLRSTILILVTLLLFEKFDIRFYWWFAFFIFWFFVAYPAYRQYQLFQNKMESFKEETLCGSCRYFDSSGQLCTLLDQHVTKNYVPCEGLNWEPKSYEGGI